MQQLQKIHKCCRHKTTLSVWMSVRPSVQPYDCILCKQFKDTRKLFPVNELKMKKNKKKNSIFILNLWFFTFLLEISAFLRKVTPKGILSFVSLLVLVWVCVCKKTTGATTCFKVNSSCNDAVATTGCLLFAGNASLHIYINCCMNLHFFMFYSLFSFLGFVA